MWSIDVFQMDFVAQGHSDKAIRCRGWAASITCAAGIRTSRASLSLANLVNQSKAHQLLTSHGLFSNRGECESFCLSFNNWKEVIQCRVGS